MLDGIIHPKGVPVRDLGHSQFYGRAPVIDLCLDDVMMPTECLFKPLPLNS